MNSSAKKRKKHPKKLTFLRIDPYPPPFLAIFFPTYKHENRSYFDPVLTTPIPGGGVLGMHLGKCELSSLWGKTLIGKFALDLVSLAVLGEFKCKSR